MSKRLEARRLVELRDRWLNPPEWVDEQVPGYPKRPIPRDEDAAKTRKKRTLTNPSCPKTQTNSIVTLLFGRQPCGAKYPRFCADSKGV